MASEPIGAQRPLLEQELARGYFQVTEDLVTAVDESGTLLYANAAIERIFGLSPGECVGRCAFDFVHAGDRPRTEAAFRRWLADDSGEPLVFENRQLHADGSVRDVLWTITRQAVADGRTTLVSCAKDITAIRAAERELEHRETSLRAMLAGMLDAVVTIDLHGIIQFASESTRTMFGYEPDELVGCNVNVLMPEPHRSQHDGYLARYRETGKTWILNTTRELQAMHRSGARFWVEISVARIDVPAGEPLVCGTIRDVTVRKRSEQAIAQSEARFRAIFDQELQLVGLLDPTGRVLEINRAALDLAGVRREDVVGRFYWETPGWSRDPDLQRRCREWIHRAARGEFVRAEAVLVDKDGERRSLDFSLRPVLDAEGEVAMLLPEARDITAFKKAQERETQMLKALAAIGESASILAHEIKNPITSINLALRAVANQLGEDEKSVLQELVGRMQRLERMIRRTLAFTRPHDLECAPSDVLPLLLGPVETLRAEAEEQDVDLELSVAPGCPRVFVDEGLIDEVVTNLLRNALDAVDPAGKVRVEAAAGGPGEVRISVEDDGPGIPEHLRDSLFRPFVTTKTKGTGLGLALVKKIVEEHGGRIRVENGRSLGGARFELELPVARDEDG